ncbi:hypothetical protein SNOG_11042 [Parastagonospora nodorum SN15]|uniref:Uncharacterized protein n=1 Tax=Phaeosphaeria nodorum (strain SN15 / ATCC MYA-4574 / FGSC 10173) TaxID=321614 RepID=Q0UB22_PHANO|nr:hypothetical protein SNOG_11042 [Parastagonospora nodorum SN15]EAT81541.1 hypothetical protein SNOG_11042 [Parastagonospora nodorum SN15]
MASASLVVTCGSSAITVTGSNSAFDFGNLRSDWRSERK